MSWQIHYNKGADLFTYLADSSVFAVKDGYIDILTGASDSNAVVFYRLGYDIGPGLGIEINETLVRETAARYVNEKPWRNEVWSGPDGSFREW